MNFIFSECVVEFKLNKDMVEFLFLRGVLKKEQLKHYQEELQKFENTSRVQHGTQESGNGIRNRRSSPTFQEKCCCPPKNVYMPSFITERKFDQLIDRLKEELTDTEN